jgi:hypothetical protein
VTALAVLFTIVGTWHGTLNQQGFAPFTVSATIRGTDASARNTVLYSGLDCRGTWRFIDHRAGAFRFKETITAGRSASCKGTGVVTLRPVAGGRLSYTFVGGGVTSRGTLTRR